VCVCVRARVCVCVSFFFVPRAFFVPESNLATLTLLSAGGLLVVLAPQLAAFGRNPWETPFGRVADAASLKAVGSFFSYGDMPPYGKGVQPQRVKSEG